MHPLKLQMRNNQKTGEQIPTQNDHLEKLRVRKIMYDLQGVFRTHSNI